MKTQLERLLEILKQMKVDITEEDRKLAVVKFTSTVSTLSRYLNGKGSSIDTATDFIVFFKERIADRDRKTVWAPKLESDKQIA